MGNLKISRLIKNKFINTLATLIDQKIIGNEALGLESFFRCRDDFAANSDPFITYLRTSLEKLNKKRTNRATITEKELIDIVRELQQENELQNVPCSPIVVYLMDEETK